MVSVPTMKIMELEKKYWIFFHGDGSQPVGLCFQCCCWPIFFTKELTNHVFNCISTSNSYVVLGPLDRPLALKHPTVIFYYYRIHTMCFSYSVKNWSFSVLFLLVNNRGGSPFFYSFIHCCSIQSTRFFPYSVGSKLRGYIFSLRPSIQEQQHYTLKSRKLRRDKRSIQVRR